MQVNIIRQVLNLINYLEMPRGQSERKNNQLQRFDRRNPFDMHNQMLRHFDFFGRDDFFSGGLMRPFGDPLSEMMEFSNAHKNMHGSGKQGSYVCQTFVSSSTMGPDGKIRKQTYVQNNAGQNRGGQTISQKQQAYKNSDGIKRVAEERMLNDKGHKIIKEKKSNGEVDHTNHYYNLQEHEADRFHQDWRGVNQQHKFLENVGRVQQSIGQGYQQSNRPRQLGYEQPRREEKAQKPSSREQTGVTSNRPEIESRGGASQKGSNYQDSRSRKF